MCGCVCANGGGSHVSVCVCAWGWGEAAHVCGAHSSGLCGMRSRRGSPTCTRPAAPGGVTGQCAGRAQAAAPLVPAPDLPAQEETLGLPRAPGPPGSSSSPRARLLRANRHRAGATGAGVASELAAHPWSQRGMPLPTQACTTRGVRGTPGEHRDVPAGSGWPAVWGQQGTETRSAWPGSR